MPNNNTGKRLSRKVNIKFSLIIDNILFQLVDIYVLDSTIYLLYR